MTAAASSSSNQQSLLGGPRGKVVQWALLGMGACAAIGGLYWWSPQWLPLVGLKAAEEAAHSTATAAENTAPEQVRCRRKSRSLPRNSPPQTCNLCSTRTTDFRHVRTVPGKLDYNSSQRLELKCLPRVS